MSPETGKKGRNVGRTRERKSDSRKNKSREMPKDERDVTDKAATTSQSLMNRIESLHTQDRRILIEV